MIILSNIPLEAIFSISALAEKFTATVIEFINSSDCSDSSSSELDHPYIDQSNLTLSCPAIYHSSVDSSVIIQVKLTIVNLNNRA